MGDKQQVAGLSGKVVSSFPMAHGGSWIRKDVVISDGNEVKLAIWERKDLDGIQQGQTITVFPGSGKLTINSYNGKVQVSVGKGCTIDVSGSEGAAPAPSAPAVGSLSSPKQATGGGAQNGSALNLKQLANAFAKSVKFTYDAVLSETGDENLARVTAARAPEFVPLWWFGEKWPTMPKASLASVLAKEAEVSEESARKFISGYCTEQHHNPDMTESQLTDSDKAVLMSNMMINNLKQFANPPAQLESEAAQPLDDQALQESAASEFQGPGSDF
tara:strand:+ start:6526 stop:7347 length:822 start_codon:yes stop_codon:yes gene_type:complete